MANNEKRPPMGGHGPGGRGAVEKAKDFKGTTKKLVNDYLSKYKIKCFLILKNVL